MNNDYVVVEFDIKKMNPMICGQIMKLLSRNIDKSKLIGVFDGASISTMSLNNIVQLRNMLDKRISELEK